MENKAERFYVYVTKYALTKGVLRVEVEDCGSGVVKGYMECYRKGQWYRNRKDAVKKAEDMRVRRLRSLDKQVKRLQALRFDTVS